jgi:3-oxoacyl-[acyl-carrier protein] reductase
MFGRLDDKVAIVTGGGRGIGAGIARVFAAAGAKVMIATRTAEHGQATVDAITNAGGTAAVLSMDVGELASIERLVAQTTEKWNGLDIVVHNAASFEGDPVDAYNEVALETVLAVNLKACFRLTKAALPHMRSRGGGRILVTSSVTGPRVALPGTAYYAASKSGVNGFLKVAALELAAENITVNGVEPGFIRTAAMELLADEEGLAQMTRYIPAGYMGDPEDIAYAMLYLASDEARYITGQTICVDGGSTLPESPVYFDEDAGAKALGS